MAQDWYKRAQLALEKGNEELAREALNRRQIQTDEATSLQSQIDLQAASIDKLYEGTCWCQREKQGFGGVYLGCVDDDDRIYQDSHPCRDELEFCFEYFFGQECKCWKKRFLKAKPRKNKW